MNTLNWYKKSQIENTTETLEQVNPLAQFQKDEQLYQQKIDAEQRRQKNKYLNDLKYRIQEVIIEALKKTPPIKGITGKTYIMNKILMPKVTSLRGKTIKVNLITVLEQSYKERIQKEVAEFNVTPETIINDLITSFMHSDLNRIAHPVKQIAQKDKLILTAYGQYNNPIEVIL